MSVEYMLPYLGKGEITNHDPSIDEIDAETIKSYSPNVDLADNNYVNELVLRDNGDGDYFCQLVLHGNYWSSGAKEKMSGARFTLDGDSGSLISTNIEVGPDWDIAEFRVTVTKDEDGKKSWQDVLQWEHQQTGERFQTSYTWRQ